MGIHTVHRAHAHLTAGGGDPVTSALAEGCQEGKEKGRGLSSDPRTARCARHRIVPREAVTPTEENCQCAKGKAMFSSEELSL